MASEKVQNFIDALAPQAIALGAEYGLDPMLILSQGALESGWGESTSGNNVFGVKSHGQPGGKTVLTHEEIDGKMVPVYDSFRTYDSPAASMRDYAQFLKENPRYGGVFGQTGNSAIDAVANAGYATDSNYASKLKAIANMIDLSPYQGQSMPLMSYAGQSNAPSALKAINSAAPVRLPAIGPTGGQPGGLGAAWANPLQFAKGLIPGMQQQVAAAPAAARQALAGPLMGTVAGRTALFNSLVPSNIGAAPTVADSRSGLGTPAMAVTRQGASPVGLVGGGIGGMATASSPMFSREGQDMNIYRANRNAIGSPINANSVALALANGATLYSPRSRSSDSGTAQSLVG